MSQSPTFSNGTSEWANAHSKVYDDLPLSDDGSQIRILEILPGAAGERLECRIIVRRLCATIRFEALSYTWGDWRERKTITVNGHTLHVTSNLECALQHLRKTNRRRWLWADAVCINQHDYDERSVQVRHMGQIYRHAEQVLIWLGPAGEHTDLALNYVKWAGTESCGDTFKPPIKHFDPLHYVPRDDLKITYGFECPRCEDSCWCASSVQTRLGIQKGLEDLMQREWWTRLWIVQEVAMAAADPAVGCGMARIPWSKLVAYEKSGNYWPGPREPITHLHDIRLDIKKQPRLRDPARGLTTGSDAAAADDVSHWLLRTAGLHCQDPKDKVYALLGMTRSKRWREFRPDYSMPVSDLVSELASLMIKENRNLDILTLCRAEQYEVKTKLPDGTMIERTSPDDEFVKSSAWVEAIVNATPSWIPDFSREGLPYLATMKSLDEDSSFRQLLDGLQPFFHKNIHITGGILPRSLPRGTVARTDHAISRRVLKVYGVILDTVEDCPNVELELSVMTLYDWVPVWLALDPAYLNIGDGTDMDTLVNGLLLYSNLTRRYNKMLEGESGKESESEKVAEDDSKGKPESEKMIKSPPEEVEKVAKQLFELEKSIKLEERAEAIQRALKGRRLFITTQGLLGIGPTCIMPQDLVVLLNGSAAAFALRPLDYEDSSECTLLGNVFVNTPQSTHPGRGTRSDKYLEMPTIRREKGFTIW